MINNTLKHESRELAVAALYSMDFNNRLNLEEADYFAGKSEEEVESLDEEVRVMTKYLVSGTIENLDEIDKVISKYSKNRPIEKIDYVDRNILRVSIFQLMFSKDTHPVIIIDEAVKLSQSLSNDVSYKFINGILDAYAKASRS